MIIQGSNNPLTVTFDSDISEIPTLVATLWSNTKLKEWTLTDMTVDGDTATMPLTEAETAAFPQGILALEVKGLDEDGNTVFWDEVPVRVVGRRDKTILLTE